jgi:hypothetical protein
MCASLSATPFSPYERHRKCLPRASVQGVSRRMGITEVNVW